MTTEQDAGNDIIAACRELSALGLNQGTSGNVSTGLGNKMLTSPSAVPYDEM